MLTPRGAGRQTGLGFGSTMARVGGIVAPLVKMMDEYYPFLPPAVYGVAPVVAAVAAGFLPETLNTPLPDTIEEVESRWACGRKGWMVGGTDGWVERWMNDGILWSDGEMNNWMDMLMDGGIGW